MKKKTLIIITVVALICVLGLLAGFVFAKYISVLQANGEAQIAKWSFESNLKNNGQSVTNSQIQLQNTYNNIATTLLVKKFITYLFSSSALGAHIEDSNAVYRH